MIKIILADDHSIVRSGLKKILKEETDIEVIGEASNYQEIFALLNSQSPDLVLLDISMPGRNGLDILKEIKANYNKIRVLILSMHPEDRYAVRAIRGGASGYVSKESAAETLVDAIHRVYNGTKYISAGLAEKLATYFETEREKPAHENLSDREFQVLLMIASGKTIKNIAGELSLSPATIGTFRGRIMIKLQLKSNVDLTNYVSRNHLVD